jgi:Flp pilus assembly protein TadG
MRGALVTRHWARGGQALIEFAMVVPLLLLLVALTLNFGGLINAWVTVQSTTRAAANYAILSGSSAGLPVQATKDYLTRLIAADMSGLPSVSPANPAGTGGAICVRQKNNNATPVMLLETPGGACGNYSLPVSDGEPIADTNSTQYINVTVDITYNYTSFFTGNSILGLPLTVLPSNIHQRTVMRLQ